MKTFKTFLLEYASIPQSSVTHVKTMDNGTTDVFEVHTGFGKKVVITRLKIGHGYEWYVKEGGFGNVLSIDTSDYYSDLKEVERYYPQLSGISHMEIFNKTHF